MLVHKTCRKATLLAPMESSSHAEALGEPQLPPVETAQSHENLKSVPLHSKQSLVYDTSRALETSKVEAHGVAANSPSDFSASNTTSLSLSWNRPSLRWSESSSHYPDRRSSTSSPYSSGHGFSRFVNRQKSRSSAGDSAYYSSSIPERIQSAVDDVNPTGSCIYSEPLAVSSHQGFSFFIPDNILKRGSQKNPSNDPSNSPLNSPLDTLTSTLQIPASDVVEAPEPPEHSSAARSLSEIPDSLRNVEALGGTLPKHQPNLQPSDLSPQKNSGRLVSSFANGDRDLPRYGHLPTEPLGPLEAIERTDSLPENTEDAQAKPDLLSLWTKMFNTAPRHLDPIIFDPKHLEKVSRDRYMDRMAELPIALVHRWNESIKPQLDQDLQRLVHSADGAKEFILSNVQLCMVGLKRGNTLYAQPTILITCGTKECKRRVEKDLRRLKLHYLHEFGRPIHFRYQPSPLYWAASMVTPQDLSDEETLALNSQKSCLEDLNMDCTSCGLNLEFTVRQSGHQERFNTTLGGILCIGGEFYGMTTAHTFLANWDSIAQRGDRDSLVLRPTVNPHRMLSEVEVYDGLAYSFFGNVARINSHFNTLESSACSYLEEVSRAHSRSSTVISSASDWALFAIPPSWILPNIHRPRGYLTSISPKLRLRPGIVHILHSLDSRCVGHLTQPSTSFYTKNGVMDVREVVLETPLPIGASGSWIVRDSEVCGYVVAITGVGLSCFMVPMESAFQDIEAVFGQDILFGRELHEAIQMHNQKSEESIQPNRMTENLKQKLYQDAKYPNSNHKNQIPNPRRGLSAQPPAVSTQDVLAIASQKSLRRHRKNVQSKARQSRYAASCPDTLNRPVNTSHKGAMNFDPTSAFPVRDVKL